MRGISLKICILLSMPLYLSHSKLPERLSYEIIPESFLINYTRARKPFGVFSALMCEKDSL